VLGQLFIATAGRIQGHLRALVWCVVSGEW
jgi:hypothetical protein